MMQTELIFAWFGPRGGLPFFIGRTSPVVGERGQHVDRDVAPHIEKKLIAKLADVCATGTLPRMAILEETTNGEQAETAWVERWIAEGAELVNDPPPVQQQKSLTLRLPEPEYRMLREHAYKSGKTHQQVMREAVVKSLQETGQ